MIYDVIVVGGGASGLYFSFINTDLKVLILEKNKNLGEKLSITGGGRCNITQHGHYKDICTSFRHAEKFVMPAVSKLSPEKFRKKLEKRGIETVVDERFRVYPKHMNARQVVEDFISKGNAEFSAGTSVLDIKKSKEGIFTVLTDKGNFLSRKVLIASGGEPSSGVHAIVESMGHLIVPLSPALVGIRTSDEKLKELTGMSVICGVRLDDQKEVIGEIIFTHKGISGPVILDLSTGVHSGSEIALSFIKLSAPLLETAIMEYTVTHGQRTLSSFLGTLIDYRHDPLPANLRRILLEVVAVDPDMKCGQLTAIKRKAIVRAIKDYKVKVLGTLGFEDSMVTKGGVSIAEVDRKTMQSRVVEGMYFSGEVLDVDGPSGGYNLHWAFSSASLAYESIVHALHAEKGV